MIIHISLKYHVREITFLETIKSKAYIFKCSSYGRATVYLLNASLRRKSHNTDAKEYFLQFYLYNGVTQQRIHALSLVHPVLYGFKLNKVDLVFRQKQNMRIYDVLFNSCEIYT